MVCVKVTLLFCVISISSFLGYSQEKQTMSENIHHVGYNVNLETLNIMFLLTDEGGAILEENEDFYLCNITASEFQNFKSHPSIHFLNFLIAEELISIYQPYFALYHSDLPEFEKKLDYGSEFYQNEKYTPSEIDSIHYQLVLAVKKFYLDADIRQYIMKNAKLFSKMEREVKQSADISLIVSSLNEFFGVAQNKSMKFIIIPSLSIFSGWGYGFPLTNHPDTFFYQILSNWRLEPIYSFDSLLLDSNLGFSDKKYNLEMIIHEFSHSYFRFIDRQENVKQIEELAYLSTYEIRKTLSDLGYNDSWVNIFEEHLVRATEIIILNKIGDNEFANFKLKEDTEEYGFKYLPFFVENLNDYDQNKAHYKNLENFLPIFLTRFKKFPN